MNGIFLVEERRFRFQGIPVLACISEGHSWFDSFTVQGFLKGQVNDPILMNEVPVSAPTKV